MNIEPPPLHIDGQLITDNEYGEYLYLREGDYINGCHICGVTIVWFGDKNVTFTNNAMMPREVL